MLIVADFLFLRLRLSGLVGRLLINRSSRRPHIEKLAAAKIYPSSGSRRVGVHYAASILQCVSDSPQSCRQLENSWLACCDQIPLLRIPHGVAHFGGFSTICPGRRSIFHFGARHVSKLGFQIRRPPRFDAEARNYKCKSAAPLKKGLSLVLLLQCISSARMGCLANKGKHLPPACSCQQAASLTSKSSSRPLQGPEFVVGGTMRHIRPQSLVIVACFQNVTTFRSRQQGYAPKNAGGTKARMWGKSQLVIPTRWGLVGNKAEEGWGRRGEAQLQSPWGQRACHRVRGEKPPWDHEGPEEVISNSER
jgi:hypothetical protein